MLILIIVLLALWLILAVLGFAIEGLMWLAIIGIVLFVATGLIGIIRRVATGRRETCRAGPRTYERPRRRGAFHVRGE
ncbi:MAG: hypothetical protein ACTHMQ_04170 [Protaetiibacter sp.]